MIKLAVGALVTLLIGGGGWWWHRGEVHDYGELKFQDGVAACEADADRELEAARREWNGTKEEVLGGLRKNNDMLRQSVQELIEAERKTPETIEVEVVDRDETPIIVNEKPDPDQYCAVYIDKLRVLGKEINRLHSER